MALINKYYLYVATNSIMRQENTIRLAIPSKGRMQSQVEDFFEKCGLVIERKSRNYLATISGFPNIQIVYQRQQDIVTGVNNGLLDFGIAGYDLTQEIPEPDNDIIIMHEGLGFGKCQLEVAIPETWEENSISDLAKYDRSLLVATKFPRLTKTFLDRYGIDHEFVEGAGTLEVSPALGNSDIIVDLVSTGATLAANRLKRIDDGVILESEGVFIGNRNSLNDEETLHTARRLLEYVEATLRAENFVSVHANMRGNDAEAKIEKLMDKRGLEGLEGPTVSKVISKHEGDWFAIHIIVAKADLMEAIESLREVGGAGIVVTPCKYIFEEKIDSFLALQQKLGN